MSTNPEKECATCSVEYPQPALPAQHNIAQILYPKTAAFAGVTAVPRRPQGPPRLTRIWLNSRSTRLAARLTDIPGISAPMRARVETPSKDEVSRYHSERGPKLS